MKIQTITINNYKAFLGKHPINVGGKNLFVYGENGSGKSSLYYALKDFFQASIEEIHFSQLENIFIPDSEKGTVSIHITLKPPQKSYQLSNTQNDTRSTTDTSIRDANKLKSFRI
mgnify:CR=1 FL=1